jgi:hypothetical protein
LAGTIFKDLNLGEVAILLEGFAEGLLETTGLLTIALVHLDLEIYWFVLMRET